MNLLDVVTGKYDEANPVPKSTGSALFTNMTNENIQAIQNALDAHG